MLLPIDTLALLQGVPGHHYIFRLSPDHGDPVVGAVREDGRDARIDLLPTRRVRLTEEFSVEVQAFGVAGDELRVRVSTDHSTSRASDGDEHGRSPEVQTLEISDLTPTRVDPAIFRIPGGLTRRDGGFFWRF